MQKRVLERHMLCHQEATLMCDQCGYKCRRKQDLARHVRAMHTGKVRRRRHEEFIATLFRNVGVIFIREFVIRVATYAGRKFARIDFYIEMAWGDLYVECDEAQHQVIAIGDECKRMAAIWWHHRQCKPDRRLHIVRFNPTAYKEDGRIERATEDEQKESLLQALAYVPEAPFTISYLFYRVVNGQPAVTLDTDYTLREYVRIV